MRKAILDNEVIELDRLTTSEIKQLKGRRDFFCVTCKRPVIFKNGTRNRPHFSHVGEGLSISNPESPEHILVKQSLAKWLRTQGVEVTIERRFSETPRIADVYFEYKNSKYVLEIQKSSISDPEFKQRVLDYRSVDATVLWIFLGDVKAKKNTFKLPSVMVGRGLGRLFHFCVKTAKLWIFDAPVFVSSRTVYARPVCRRLNGFRVDDLTDESRGLLRFDESWLGVKKDFRQRDWFYATKKEKKLLEQCLIRRFNLSLLPSEVGWPVDGDAMGKHLFVWQSYVLLTLMKHFNLGDVFAPSHLLRFLTIEYQVVVCDRRRMQVAVYLKWLVMFGVVRERGRYFEYVKLPKICTNMEDQLSRDEKFVEIAVNLWKAL